MKIRIEIATADSYDDKPGAVEIETEDNGRLVSLKIIDGPYESKVSLDRQEADQIRASIDLAFAKRGE